MAVQHSECPTKDELARLLDDTQPEVNQPSLVSHLDDCDHCQILLQQLADSGSGIQKLVQEGPSTRPESNSAYWPALKKIHEHPPASEAEDRLDQSRETQFGTDDWLGFLQPSTMPGSLGRLGQFEVLRLIGRGGMGLVLEATDTSLYRPVALKVLDPRLAHDELAQMRFCREARSAASVTHDNVVPIYQVERIGKAQLPMLVMQLVNGESLDKRLARQRPLPLRDILSIGWQTAAGLAAAHSRGIIHRDIKPGNILVESGTGRVRLTDFGLARCMEDLNMTRSGFVAGTPLYMSPEQALGEPLDERSDLFSLGAVLFEMCAGRPPFSGGSPLAVLKQITDRPAPSVQSLSPNTPEWLGKLIRQLLSRQPEDRPVSASIVAEILVRKLSELEPGLRIESPLIQLPESSSAIHRRHSQRRKWVGMVLSALIGAAAMMLVAWSFPKPFPQSETGPVGPPSIATLSGNAGPVWSVSITPDSRLVAMGIDDGTVKLWDITTRRLKSTLKVHEGPTWATSISPDGGLLATGHDDGTVHIWDLKTSARRNSFPAGGPIKTMAFAPDGAGLAVGTRTGLLAIWNVEDGHEVRKFDGHRAAIWNVAFSRDGKTLGSAGGDKVARLWNVNTGSERMVLEGHQGGVFDVSFSEGDRYIATGGWDKIVRIWEEETGKLVGSLEGHTADIWSVKFAPKGFLLASVGEDRDVRLWDARTLKQFPKRQGHTGTMYASAISQTGILATGSRDGSTRLWDISAEMKKAIGQPQADSQQADQGSPVQVENQSLAGSAESSTPDRPIR